MQPTVVSANRTYLGSFNCQEAHPRTGTHLSNYWTLHLCDDMLVIARRTAKSSFLKLVAGAKKEDRRKWSYDFFRLIRLDDLQVVTYTASAKDQVVTLEWPRANAEGPDGSRLQVGPGDAAVESLTVTTIADDADRTSASDTSFAMVTMAAASMANTHGASPDHDNMASFANKISKAISDWSEKSRALSKRGNMGNMNMGKHGEHDAVDHALLTVSAPPRVCPVPRPLRPAPYPSRARPAPASLPSRPRPTVPQSTSAHSPTGPGAQAHGQDPGRAQHRPHPRVHLPRAAGQRLAQPGHARQLCTCARPSTPARSTRLRLTVSPPSILATRSRPLSC